MEVFRITLRKWSKTLRASGMAARWNSDGMKVIYSAESRSLACLENVVHRSGEGLNAAFSVFVIDIPDELAVNEIVASDLNRKWFKSVRCLKCRQLGDSWLRSMESSVLKVPSAIVQGESNYLFNLAHPEFEKIKIKRIDTFEFDSRIKR